MGRIGVYIHAGSSTAFPGVDKKIRNQITVFSSCFNMKEIVVKKKSGSVIEAIIHRLPFGSFGRDYDRTSKEIEKIGKVDFFYIRNNVWDRKWTSFLKTIRTRYPDSKILLEIPTYPYSNELLQDKEMWPFYFKDLIWSRFAKLYVDKVVTFSNDDQIFGIPTIKIRNGIVVDDISEIKYTENTDKSIHLLAVAQFQKSHGYERVIRGLREYYLSKPDRMVYLHMVGDGKERQYYEALVRKYRLQEYVFFYGQLCGNSIIPLYKKAHIGLGVFGGYKRKLQSSSALKIREYLAYGLPVVSGMREDAFINNNINYYKRFPNDSSTISIEEVVIFFDSLFQGKMAEAVRKDIRQYAKRYLDMSVTMKPVIDYINSSIDTQA